MLLDGGRIYGRPIVRRLGFTYPPAAALLLAPLALAPLHVDRLVVTGLNVVALVWILNSTLVFARVNGPASLRWSLAALLAAPILWLEPVTTAIGYGQIDLLIVGLVPIRPVAPRRLAVHRHRHRRGRRAEADPAAVHRLPVPRRPPAGREDRSRRVRGDRGGQLRARGPECGPLLGQPRVRHQPGRQGRRPGQPVAARCARTPDPHQPSGLADRAGDPDRGAGGSVTRRRRRTARTAAARLRPGGRHHAARLPRLLDPPLVPGHPRHGPARHRGDPAAVDRARPADGRHRRPWLRLCPRTVSWAGATT